MNNQPETLEDLLEAWPDVADVLQALRESPDLVMGKKNLRVRPQTVVAGEESMPEAPEEDQPLAFYRVYQADDAGTDKWYLQGGGVIAGTFTATIDDFELGTVGSEPADGTDVYLEVTGDGIVDAGQLLQGFNGTAAAISSAASVPANTLPLASGATGKKCHVLLGTWNNDVFTPANGGNINVSYCPGSYNVTRY